MSDSSRRTFLAATGAGLSWLGLRQLVGSALGGQEVDADVGKACGARLTQDAKDAPDAIAIPRDELLIWIDTPVSRKKSNMGILWKKNETIKSYLSKIVLSNADKKTLGVHYFAKPESSTNQTPPIIFFDNLPIDSETTYYLYGEWIQDDKLNIHRYVLTPQDLEPSTLSIKELPPELQESFKKSHQGQISSIFRPAYGLRHFVTPAMTDTGPDISSTLLSTWIQSKDFRKLESAIFPSLGLYQESPTQFRDFELQAVFNSGVATRLCTLLVTDAIGRYLFHKAIQQPKTSKPLAYTLSIKGSKVPLNQTPYLMVFCDFDKFLIKLKICTR